MGAVPIGEMHDLNEYIRITYEEVINGGTKQHLALYAQKKVELESSVGAGAIP